MLQMRAALFESTPDGLDSDMSIISNGTSSLPCAPSVACVVVCVVCRIPTQVPSIYGDKGSSMFMSGKAFNNVYPLISKQQHSEALMSFIHVANSALLNQQPFTFGNFSQGAFFHTFHSDGTRTFLTPACVVSFRVCFAFINPIFHVDDNISGVTAGLDDLVLSKEAICNASK